MSHYQLWVARLQARNQITISRAKETLF